MTAENKQKYIKIAKHYAYVAIAGAATLYCTGETDWKALLKAAFIGILGPLVGAMNPDVKEYGYTKDSSPQQ